MNPRTDERARTDVFAGSRRWPGLPRGTRSLGNEPPLQGAVSASRRRLHLQLGRAGAVAALARGVEPRRPADARHAAPRCGSEPTPRTPTSTVVQRPLAQRLFPMPVEGEPVFARSGIPPSSRPGRSGSRRTRAAGRRLGRIRGASGGRVVVNKRIANLYRIPFLARAFPSARFVALVRDGRAVALSLSKRRLVARARGRLAGRHAARVGGRGERSVGAVRPELGRGAPCHGGGVVAPSTRNGSCGCRYEDLIAEPVPSSTRSRRSPGCRPTAIGTVASHDSPSPIGTRPGARRWMPAALATITEIQAAGARGAHGYA